ncbi:MULTISPECIES: fatty acid desaturase family protein [Gordonia]|jgi:fatty acid desaturase|uniref:Putative acyl-CoA desaturase n=1 Tax=Gordonia malaquae NBRC 108250 TaxID=1223542 RepID=M3V9M2_GORML|nr:fatty acid desaturase [Gordonia malaquae]GAC78068.1 putative acyl-CoA desaturase [Gordonia malaquae NBRC 108250]SED91461.1 linoleoyl-CoA desaturase [Gordonia malaquae]
MAISDINEYAHLTDADVEALGAELDALRREVESSLGERDARYLRRTIAAQRGLEFLGRVALLGSHRRSLWWLGTGALSAAKIIENMELGHNVMHGQWDWMNDPEVHSTTWEWDMVCASPHWKHSHNYIHHKYTNVLGMDHDVGYKILRVTRDEPWEPRRAFQPFFNIMLATTFEWGIALHDLELKEVIAGRKPMETARPEIRKFVHKAGRQMAKDYVLFPAASGPNFVHTLKANLAANFIRNLWAYVVIFCGHFPDGAEKFTMETLENETQGQWYLRQMLGSANFEAGPALAFMSGNLSYQIEHHLFPDLPSNRYADMSVRVRELCDKYDLPYNTGSFTMQYLRTLRTINKLALPDWMLTATTDDAPETASERRFDSIQPRARGLRTAIATLKERRRAAKA